MVILLGTHEYEWCITPFNYLFNKYWGNEQIIYIADYLINPLPDNIEFMQVPAYSEGEWNWAQWFSNGLASIFQYFENELLIIFLLDHWLNTPVKVDLVNQAIEYMKHKPRILRCELTAGTCLDSYGNQIDTYKDLEIISVPPNHKHCSFGGGVTFSPSIFNSKNGLQILGDHWSMHQTEKWGTEMMVTSKLKSIGTKQAILYRTHALSHQTPKQISLEGLNNKDKEVIKEMIPDGWHVK